MPFKLLPVYIFSSMLCWREWSIHNYSVYIEGTFIMPVWTLLDWYLRSSYEIEIHDESNKIITIVCFVSTKSLRSYRGRQLFLYMWGTLLTPVAWNTASCLQLRNDTALPLIYFGIFLCVQILVSLQFAKLWIVVNHVIVMNFN